MFDLTEKDLKRFWSKIKVGDDDECWPWQAALVGKMGYGSFSLSTGKSGGKKAIASRIVCYIHHGEPLNIEAHTLHSCDNPPCCNPNHLRWGTQKENSNDAKVRGRSSKPPVNYPGRHTGKMPKGNEVWNAELTEEIVREIWRLHMSNHNATQIAQQVGKTVACVYDVCRGKSWRHLPDAPSIEVLKTGGVRRGFNQFSKT